MGRGEEGRGVGRGAMQSGRQDALRGFQGLVGWKVRSEMSGGRGYQRMRRAWV